jgi:hypothetical protein
VTVIGEPRVYGMVSEYQPYWKPQWPVMYQKSYWYQCDIDTEQLAPQMESYEIANGMRPLWVPLADAIAHNEKVLAAEPKYMGLSIHRETRVLKHVAHELSFGTVDTTRDCGIEI